MKTINKILIFSLIVFLASCVDDDTRTDNFDQGPNIAGFSKSAIAANALADGNTVMVDIPILITGPTSMNLTEDIVVDISVDESSTAVAGVHYELNQSSLTLTAENGYTGSLPITVITEGIVPPLAEAPVINLNLQSVSGENMVISGRTGDAVVTINYLCFSDLEGNYTTTSAPVANVTITELSDGVYSHSALPLLTAGGNPIEFEFNDTCGVITIDYLVLGSYLTLGSGTVDPDTGIITINGYILYNGSTEDTGPFFDFSTETFIYTPE